MLTYLKRLWNSKIHINIIMVHPFEGVERTTIPKIIEQQPIKISRHRQSNLRFVETVKIDYEGKKVQYWCTEQFDGKYWMYCKDSLSSDKNDAMDLHQRIIDIGTVEPTKIVTVEWEGLSREETISWIAMNKTNE